MKKPLNWIPVWIDSWLFGSTRIELTLEQRGLWIDLLTLAGKDSGFIRANEGIPYPSEQLAGFLRVPEDVLLGTINRCIEVNKIEKLPDGTLHVASWEKYSLTSRYRRMLIPPSHTLSPKEDKKRVEKRRVKGSPPTEHTSQKAEHTSGKREITEKEGLPQIPQNISFKAQDDLRELLKEIRQTERLFDNPHRLEMQGCSVDSLRKKIEGMKTRFRQLIEDYS